LAIAFEILNETEWLIVCQLSVTQLTHSELGVRSGKLFPVAASLIPMSL
jgi:hypothetical protein